MGKINSMMEMGRRSMQNSTSALQTVSHNIANKDTKGYSRQRVEYETNQPVGFGKLRVGMGARPGMVTRINNQYLEKQLEKEGGGLGYSSSKSESMSRVEQVYNEQVNKGLNRFMGEFFNSWRELSNNPESLAIRTMVKESADFMSKDFKRVDTQLSDIQRDIDYQLSAQVEEVNSITKEIANLNEKVQLVTLQGGQGNDERDKRDQLVKDLSERVNIRYAESDDGLLTITAGNSAVLVSGYSQRDLFVGATGGSETKREGNFDIFYKPTDQGNPVNVTRQIIGGKMGALLEVRDQTINKFRDNIDIMAFTLSKEVNKAHSLGFDRYNQKGQGFFNDLKDIRGAASTIKVDDEVFKDVGKIVAAAAPNSPGDNRVANVLSSLQYQKVLGDKTATLDDYYNTVVGKVGIIANRANNEMASQQDIVKQLTTLRESISGVSLDEETTKMIEFQKAFDASARLIRTADEMMDTVLNLKRM